MNAVSEVDSPHIPWWRVINAKGGVSLAAESRAGHQQRGRLKREGVAFDAKERVDFAKVGWAGPDVAWLAEHDLLPPAPLLKEALPDEDKPQQLSLF